MPTPKSVKDIMTSQIISCDPDDTLAKARQLMKDHNIRHIPVVHALTRKFEGVITQKSILKEAFTIVNRFGSDDLERQENKRKVKDFMDKDLDTATPDTTLLEAGKFFIKVKHGCMPVVEGEKLVGILTSADFVKLSVMLLEAAKD